MLPPLKDNKNNQQKKQEVPKGAKVNPNPLGLPPIPAEEPILPDLSVKKPVQNTPLQGLPDLNEFSDTLPPLDKIDKEVKNVPEVTKEVLEEEPKDDPLEDISKYDIEKIMSELEAEAAEGNFYDFEDDTEDEEVEKGEIDSRINSQLLSVVKKQLKEGRRYFGSSGASLTHHINNPDYKDKGIDVSLARAGLEGERKTTKIIRKWMKDKPSAVLVDSIHIPGKGKEAVIEEGVMEEGDTDHCLIIGSSVVIIDSKNWKSKRRYSVTEDGEIERSNKSFPGGHVRAAQAKGMWRDYLKGNVNDIQYFVCITNEESFVVRDALWWRQAFKLMSHTDLVKWLDKMYDGLSEEDKEEPNINLVCLAVIGAIKPYNLFKEMLPDMYHLLSGGK